MNKILVLSLMLISGAYCAADVVSAPTDNAEAYADARDRLRLLQVSINNVSAEAADGKTAAMAKSETAPPLQTALAARLVTLERDSFIIGKSLDELKKPGCVITPDEKAAARELTETASDTLADARRLEYLVRDAGGESSAPGASVARITGYLLMAAQTVDSVTKTCRPKSNPKSPKSARKSKAAAE